MSEDRRKDQRKLLSAEVGFQSATNFFGGKTRDISEGGLFIETDAPLEIGTPITIELRLLRQTLWLRGEVAWQLLREGRPVGIGVCFGELPEWVRRAITRFMALRAPMPFELEVGVI